MKSLTFLNNCLALWLSDGKPVLLCFACLLHFFIVWAYFWRKCSFTNNTKPFWFSALSKKSTVFLRNLFGINITISCSNGQTSRILDSQCRCGQKSRFKMWNCHQLSRTFLFSVIFCSLQILNFWNPKYLHTSSLHNVLSQQDRPWSEERIPVPWEYRRKKITDYQVEINHTSGIISSIRIWRNVKNTLITTTDVYQCNREPRNPATMRI